jgi:ADP-ribosylglycohydrolase
VNSIPMPYHPSSPAFGRCQPHACPDVARCVVRRWQSSGARHRRGPDGEHPAFRFAQYRGQSSAYVVDTMHTVLHFYFNTESFSDCVIEAVNQGGDADTVGALAAILAGATYGLAAAPKKWINKLDRTVAAEVRQ